MISAGAGCWTYPFVSFYGLFIYFHFFTLQKNTTFNPFNLFNSFNHGIHILRYELFCSLDINPLAQKAAI